MVIQFQFHVTRQLESYVFLPEVSALTIFLFIVSGFHLYRMMHLKIETIKRRVNQENTTPVTHN